MPAQFEYDHLLHPTTLDSCLQATYAPTIGSSEARVPSSIDFIYVSTEQPKDAGAELCGFSTLFRKGRDFVGSTTMSDKSWSQPKIIMKGINFMRLGGLDGEAEPEKPPSEIRKICSQLVWKEDVSQLCQREAEQVFRPKPSISAEVREACDKASTIFKTRILDTLCSKEYASMTPNIARYGKWLRQHLESADNRAQEPGCATISPSNVVSETEADYLAELGRVSTDGQLLCEVGETLLGMIDGNIPEHYTPENNSVLGKYCSTTLGISACNDMIAKLMELSGHKRPDQKILQVGAGTASLTLQVLEALGGQDDTTPCFSQYVFTDSDATDFGNAQELLRAWGDRIKFNVLDIEKDPAQQGFEKESFDVILAGHVSKRDKRGLNRQLTAENRSYMQQSASTLLWHNAFSSLDLAVSWYSASLRIPSIAYTL